MKILDRYLIAEFIKPFAASLLIFTILVLLGRFFDKMQIFTNFHASAADIVVFLLFGLPFWLNLVLPIATLLAVLFSLGALEQRREITACRAAGISNARLFAPLFGLSLLISCISLAGGLSFLPQLNAHARNIYRVKIKKEVVQNKTRDDIVAAGRGHRRFTIRWLDIDKNLIQGLVMDQFDENLAWVYTLSAREATYENGHWVLKDGTLRRQDPNNASALTEEAFATRVVDIEEKPSDFLFEDIKPDDMTGEELIRRIAKLKRMGVPHFREDMAAHLKLALPFANAVVVALGIPFAMHSGRKGRLQTFSYALGIAFLYWGVVSICQSFGEQGRVAPWIAAWMANVLFGGVAAGLIKARL